MDRLLDDIKEFIINAVVCFVGITWLFSFFGLFFAMGLWFNYPYLSILIILIDLLILTLSVREKYFKKQ